MTREEAIQKAINIVSYFEAHFAKSKEAREDAANIIEALEQELFINKPCVSSGACEHDKNKVLEKIRAEIMSKDGFEEALEIIDKYRVESER